MVQDGYAGALVALPLLTSGPSRQRAGGSPSQVHQVALGISAPNTRSPRGWSPEALAASLDWCRASSLQGPRLGSELAPGTRTQTDGRLEGVGPAESHLEMGLGQRQAWVPTPRASHTSVIFQMRT